MADIEFRRVVKRFDSGVLALQDLSVTIPEGSMVFLTGHSGAGKSTFLNLVLREGRATRGQVVVGGVDIGQLPPRQTPLYRRHLGVVFQDPRLLEDRTAFENVALPLRVAGMRRREVGRRVRAALSGVGLLERERALPRHLSAGERQRVGIARAVVNRPKVLLADEPTGNLDPALSRHVMELFRQFHDVGTTVVVASHDQDLLAAMGLRTVELAEGRLVADSEGAYGA